jgi:hypothetical protein
MKVINVVPRYKRLTSISNQFLLSNIYNPLRISENMSQNITKNSSLKENENENDKLLVVSLGFACQVKYHINKLIYPQKTMFFDWIVTDFQSVLYVLKNINDKEMITSSNFTNNDVFRKGTWTDCNKIEHVKFKMISVHEFPMDKNYMEYMEKFIQKYSRRIDRFKSMLYSDKNIHMVHCLDHKITKPYIVTSDDLDKFDKYLHDINPNIRYFLHIVIPPKFNNIDLNRLKRDRVYVYYLTDSDYNQYDAKSVTFNLKNKKTENENLFLNWENNNFNWEIVFDNIKKIG